LKTTIRKLDPSYVDDIIALWNAAGLAIKPGGRDRPEALAAEIKAYPDNFIGAFAGDRIVGVVLATWDGRKAWINRLAVSPDCRRSGIAARLVAAAEEELDRRGALIIAALIEGDNDASIAFFRDAGYAVYDGVVYVTKRKGPDV